MNLSVTELNSSDRGLPEREHDRQGQKGFDRICIGKLFLPNQERKPYPSSFTRMKPILLQVFD